MHASRQTQKIYSGTYTNMAPSYLLCVFSRIAILGYFSPSFHKKFQVCTIKFSFCQFFFSVVCLRSFTNREKLLINSSQKKDEQEKTNNKMMEKKCSLGNNVLPIPNISQNRRRERKKEREVAEHLGKLHSTVLKSLRKLHDLLHPPFTMTRARTVR